MKTTFTFALICCTLFAGAQISHKSKNPRFLKSRNILKRIHRLNGNTNQNKTTAQDDRLIAEVYEEALVIDSSTYSYSGSRGSYLDSEYFVEFEDIQYDQLDYYDFSSTPQIQLQNKTYCTYNGNNQVLTQLDSSYGGTTYVPNYKVTNTYNTNNQLAESLTEDWSGAAWNNSHKLLNTYSNGNLIEDLSLIWNLNVWDSSYRTENVYVGNNLTESTIYNYLSAWVGTEKTKRTYNGNNQVLTEVNQIYQNPSWTNLRKDSFQYNMNNKLSVVTNYTWNNNQWEQESRAMITWTGNRVTEVELQEWNGTNWNNIEKYNYTYNANDYPLTDIATYWNGTAYVYDPNNDSYKNRYYYETYNNNVGVNDIAAEVFGDITIFPNPAQDVITVNFDNKTYSKKEAVVLDLAGAVISNTTISSSENSVQIPLNNIAKGSYIIQLRDENGLVVSKKITKN